MVPLRTGDAQDSEDGQDLRRKEDGQDLGWERETVRQVERDRARHRMTGKQGKRQRQRERESESVSEGRSQAAITADLRRSRRSRDNKFQTSGSYSAV